MCKFFSSVYHTLCRFVQNLNPEFRNRRHIAVTEFIKCNDEEKVAKARTLLKFFNHHPDVVCSIRKIRGNGYVHIYYQQHLSKFNNYPNWVDARDRTVVLLEEQLKYYSTRYSEIHKVAEVQAELDKVRYEIKTYFNTPPNHEELLSNSYEIDWLLAFMRRNQYHLR